MRISDWSSDVCSYDLGAAGRSDRADEVAVAIEQDRGRHRRTRALAAGDRIRGGDGPCGRVPGKIGELVVEEEAVHHAPGPEVRFDRGGDRHRIAARIDDDHVRSEEHTSELQSLMRISYAVLCLKTQKTNTPNT